MECEHCRPLLSRSLNGAGDLDASQRTEVEQHVAVCVNCKREVDQLRELQSALKHKSLHFKAPEDLKSRLRAAQQQPQPPPPLQSNFAPPPPQKRNGSKWGSGLAAAVVCLGLAGWSYAHFTSQNEQMLIAQEIVGAHIRSLMASHLADVISTDMHTVKPWFAGKLDFSPLVADFPEKDFTLTGGRLDYLHGRAVAALIYKHRQHVINVFTWPGDAPANLAEVRNGYNILSWRQESNGMEFWMVSDLNPSELAELKALIQQKDAK